MTRAAWLPGIFIGGLAAFTTLDTIGAGDALFVSFAVALGALTVWWLALALSGRLRHVRIDVQPRPQHYLQAIAHISIFVYWGWFWQPIADAAPLIAAQVVFAYAFDLLLSFTRRRSAVLGFGPLPIVFSTNLFLRFTDDWFLLQFALIAVGFLAKELIRWRRDGRLVHIFNPSSFPLALASLALLLTGATDITHGEAIATQLFVPPHIFAFIFLVALPGQYLFGVSSMTLSAVATTWGFSVAYHALTGTYFFVDDHIPIAVFLGMHLLFTDPSTSPRSEAGRLMFGVTYGLSVVLLYQVLTMLGLPTFYDKLLQVPLMNLAVRRFDVWAAAPWIRRWGPEAWWPTATASGRRLAYTGAWAVGFAVVSALGHLGDHHPGHSVRVWADACDAGRTRGCAILEQIESAYCGGGSPWACNDLGVRMARGQVADTSREQLAFQRACQLGLEEGCLNLRRIPGVAPLEADPLERDWPILLNNGKGPAVFASVADRAAEACRQGWTRQCAQPANGR